MEMRVSGMTGDRSWNHVRTLDSAGGIASSGISQLWAERKIESFFDQLIDGRDEREVRREVIDVALRYHLVSKYTSLVAVDLTPSGVDPALCESSYVPVNMPDGMTTGRNQGTLPQTATPSSLLILCGIVSLLLGATILRFQDGPGWATVHAFCDRRRR